MFFNIFDKYQLHIFRNIHNVNQQYELYGEIMNNKFFISVWTIFFSFMILGSVLAAGETEYILEKKITSTIPIFMPSHVGDQNWIQGFQIEGNIFLKGNDEKIGNFRAKAQLANPPLSLVEEYGQIFLSVQNEILDIASFTVTAHGVAMGSSAQNGDIILAWFGSIADGTGILENNFGLSAGNSVSNIFTGEGVITEVLNIRNGL
ncbi:MAG: hypothetical protein V3V00_06710 [Saprospiraceae bacterium]